MTNDGTQDPVPPPVLADPLSGLVTGGRYEPEPLKVRVVEPPMPDITAVREAMEGMLDDDSELDLELVSQLAPRIPTQATPAEPPPAAPPAAPEAAKPAPEPAAAAPAPAAEVPPPVTDPAPTPPIGIPVQKKPDTPVPVKVVAPPDSVERPRRLPLGWPRMRRRQAPPRPASAIGRKSSAPSVAAIVLLLLVIVVIAIVFLASLIDTFASIFS